MSFISEEEIKGKGANYLAPMIDFLFLMLVFFASLAVSRVATRDTEIELVKIKEEVAPSRKQGADDQQVINISVNDQGQYKWVTEIRDYEMKDAQSIADELASQYERGLLAEDREKTQILLKIDRKTKWEAILKVLFAVREIGFQIRPVYEPEKES